jgi:FkbM family methyltransferase
MLNNFLKLTIQYILKFYLTRRILNKVFHILFSDIKKTVKYNDISLIFHNLNEMTNARIMTFSTKEPETLEWIDTFEENSVLWDIGANIGLYSIYAGKKKNCKVIAFEPSVFNLELLARNVFTNQLTNQIYIFPLPLSDSVKQSSLSQSMTDWGGSQSTFEKEYDFEGKKMKNGFEYPTIGVDGDFAFLKLGLPQPNYIKIDVDGIEHIILKGMKKILLNVQSVLVEINDDFKEQKVISENLLSEHGFKLFSKRHSEMFSGTIMSNVYNQIWKKNN